MKFGPALKRKIVAMHADGKGVADVAKAFDVNYQKAWRWWKNSGLPPMTQARAAAKPEEALSESEPTEPASLAAEPTLRLVPPPAPSESGSPVFDPAQSAALRSLVSMLRAPTCPACNATMLVLASQVDVRCHQCGAMLTYR